jgi:hypothetical protein
MEGEGKGKGEGRETKGQGQSEGKEEEEEEEEGEVPVLGTSAPVPLIFWLRPWFGIPSIKNILLHCKEFSTELHAYYLSFIICHIQNV